jgi:hypothetical protein
VKIFFLGSTSSVAMAWLGLAMAQLSNLAAILAH